MPDSFETPWTVDLQAPLSMGFPRQYYSGLSFPSLRDPSTPGIKSMSSALAGGFFTTEPPGKPLHHLIYLRIYLILLALSTLVSPVYSLYLWFCFNFVFVFFLICFVFWILHISEIIQYLSFSVCLFLFSIIPLMSIHVVTIDRFPYLLYLNNIPLCVWHSFVLILYWSILDL